MPIDAEQSPGGVSDAGRVVGAVAAGVAAGIVVSAVGQWSVAPVAAWDVAAATFTVWVWVSIWRLDAEATSRFATREDPSRATADLLLLSASVASLAAVGLLLVEAGNHQGATQALLVGLALVSVVLSWVAVHTVYTLHYARLYYAEPAGGVDFNEDVPPQYSDFAYLAFTIGMTFQVSDTNITTKPIRAAALRQALLSYLFGAVILATTINAIASLSN